MLELTTLSWLVVIGTALATGLSKTSGISVMLLFVPLAASVLGAHASVGFILPMLCMADIIAVIHWRRHVLWRPLLRLLPWTFLGMAIGYYCLGRLANDHLMAVIGLVILGMVAFTFWRSWRPNPNPHVPRTWWFAALMGLLAGTTTVLANAAGPPTVIYLLAMRLQKENFVATTAWFFWILNLIKLPLFLHLHLITADSFRTNLALLPAIALGALLGALLIRRIPQRPFIVIVSLLAAVAALVLCLKGLT